MMFQNNCTQRNSDIFSYAMQRRMDMMLQNADQLFSLGWLRKRLWKEWSRRIQEEPATEYGNYSHVLQGSFESSFMWEFLSVCQKSLASIKRILGNAYERQDPLGELLEEREELIREFARMPLSKTWEYVKDDDLSWRNFARRLPLNDPSRKEDISHFFEMLDRISVITDIVCHRASEYGLEVDYSSMGDYEIEQRRAELTDEVLVKAIEAVSYHFSSQSAWAAVYGVLRDDYDYQNKSQFERDVAALPFKKKVMDCPKDTISKTMRNNDYLYSPIEKWPADSKFTKFANDLRAAIKAELFK